MTTEQRNQFFAIRKALDGFVTKITNSPTEINDNYTVIRLWKPDNYKIDDVRLFQGTPYKCIQAHNSKQVPSWDPTVSSLWMQYHGTSPESARPWIQPLGAHDMYKNGEYMIWTDGKIYQCVVDTIYSPNDYMQAWNVVE